jgi:hypothetical protein
MTDLVLRADHVHTPNRPHSAAACALSRSAAGAVEPGVNLDVPTPREST